LSGCISEKDKNGEIVTSTETTTAPTKIQSTEELTTEDESKPVRLWNSSGFEMLKVMTVRYVDSTLTFTIMNGVGHGILVQIILQLVIVSLLSQSPWMMMEYCVLERYLLRL